MGYAVCLAAFRLVPYFSSLGPCLFFGPLLARDVRCCLENAALADARLCHQLQRQLYVVLCEPLLSVELFLSSAWSWPVVVHGDDCHHLTIFATVNAAHLGRTYAEPLSQIFPTRRPE